MISSKSIVFVQSGSRCRLRRVNGFENNAITARNLALVTFVVLPRERLHETAERALFERGDVVEEACRRSGGIALSYLAAPSWMWTIQVMSELGERYKLSLAHLPFGLFHQSALFGSEHVVRIGHAPRLDEHAILLFGERHKIPFLDVQGFEHLPRNDHLAPLAYATDPLSVCG